MIIMGQPIFSILIFSGVVALIVFAAGFVIPMITGRPRDAMSVIDIVALMLFIAVVIFLLRTLGWWNPLVVGI